jgi:hypothetical protein
VLRRQRPWAAAVVHTTADPAGFSPATSLRPTMATVQMPMAAPAHCPTILALARELQIVGQANGDGAAIVALEQ